MKVDEGEGTEGAGPVNEAEKDALVGGVSAHGSRNDARSSTFQQNRLSFGRNGGQQAESVIKYLSFFNFLFCFFWVT